MLTSRCVFSSSFLCRRFLSFRDELTSSYLWRTAQKLDYHSTECIYAPTAYRGYARALVKDLEAVRPSAIVDLVRFLFSLSIRPILL